jgi:hypothetical protein
VGLSDWMNIWLYSWYTMHVFGFVIFGSNKNCSDVFDRRHLVVLYQCNRILVSL